MDITKILKLKYHCTTICQTEYKNFTTMAPRKSPEFIKMVVDEAINSGNNLKVGNKHGVSESTLRTWIQKSGRQEEARKLNPRSQKVAKRQGAPPKRKVPTADRKGTPFHLDVDNGVLEFITRKRSEVG